MRFRLLLMTKILSLALICFYSLSAQAVKFEQVTFDSHSIQLSGTIVYPQTKPYNSVVVFVHGSGPQERNLHWATKFAQNGIAALVYDKRGVGKSGGEYESNQSVSGYNLDLLADDAVAALNFLERHPPTKQLKRGLTGISQAGWIIPIAAEKSKKTDFMVIWSGPVCKVSEEDIFSKYTADLDSKRVPSYSQALNARTTKYIWPDFLGKDTNPSDNLKNLNIPGLWIFGEQDGSVPVDLSIKRLQQLINTGFNYEYVSFSKLGHNNMTETFSTAVSWINNQSSESK